MTLNFDDREFDALDEIAEVRRRLDRLESFLRKSEEPDLIPIAVAPRAREITPFRAAQIARCGVATIYRWSTKFGIGRQLESGSWRIDETKLREFLASRR